MSSSNNPLSNFTETLDNFGFFISFYGLTTGEDHAVVFIGGFDEFSGGDGAVQA